MPSVSSSSGTPICSTSRAARCMVYDNALQHHKRILCKYQYGCCHAGIRYTQTVSHVLRVEASSPMHVKARCSVLESSAR